MRDREHQEQAAFIEWCEWNRSLYPELEYIFAIPNGGLRDKVTAGKLKAEGVKAGVPDLCLPVARGGYHGLYLEVKFGTNRMTKDQKRWHLFLVKQGYCVGLCYGFEELEKTITTYLGLSDDDLIHQCGTCGSRLEHVRPGKWQCPECG